jgi:hypothetical protein
MYKFKKGDTFKVGTGETAYEVIREELEGGNLWAVIAGTEHGRFRFNNKYDDLTLIAKAEDPYEYAVIQSTPKNGDHPPHEEEWTTRTDAERNLRAELAAQEVRKTFRPEEDYPFKDWKFRIVKRRKAGKIEEL